MRVEILFVLIPIYAVWLISFFLLNWLFPQLAGYFQRNERNMLYVLIGWTTLGFLTTFENSEDWGCLIMSTPIFGPENVILFVVSLGLFLAAQYSREGKGFLLFITIEGLYWALKLLLNKGGYAVGFGGTPEPTIVLYDLTACLFRASLLSMLYLKSANLSLILWIVIFGLISVKSLFFATPMIELNFY